MGGVVRRGLATAVVVSAVGAAMTGCAAPAGPDDAAATGGGPSPASSAQAPTPPATASPPTPAPSPEQSLPPELDWVPPEEEIDRIAVVTEEAFRTHLTAYDAAARTGFTDPALQKALLATAGADTLEGLHLQAEAMAGTGRTVAGDSELLGMSPIGLDPPVAGGFGITVVSDACVLMAGTLLEADGTVVRRLDWGEPQLLRVRVADDDGTWRVTNQQQLATPCPAELLGDDGA